MAGCPTLAHSELLLGRGPSPQPLRTTGGAARAVAVSWQDIASGFAADVNLTVLSSINRRYPYLHSRAALAELDCLAHPQPPVSRQMTARELVAALRSQRDDLYYSCLLAATSASGSPRTAAGTLGPRLATSLLEQLRGGLPPAVTAQVNLFVASSSSCTPVHFDGAHNSLHQLEGRKRVWLWSPDDAAALFTLYPSESEAHRSAHDAFAWTPGEPPAEIAARALVFDLAPGDQLFVPAYWAHHVCAGDDAAAASLSLWVDSAAAHRARAMAQLSAPFAREWDPGERLTAALHVFSLAAASYSGAARMAARDVRASFAATFDFASRDVEDSVPAHVLLSLCGIGDSDSALSHLWGAARGLPPVDHTEQVTTTVSAAMASTTSAAVQRLFWANWLQSLILQTLGITSGQPAPRVRGALVPHIVARCLATL